MLPLRSWLILGAMVAGCASTPPDDLLGYQAECTQMNAEPIPVYDGDPHRGTKNVFACQVPLVDLAANIRPFPDGALIVKEARRDGDDFAWLIAAARKQGGTWRWDEYTRNFADEEFRHILSGEGVCTGCHQAARSSDWIFTRYDRARSRPIVPAPDVDELTVRSCLRPHGAGCWDPTPPAPLP